MKNSGNRMKLRLAQELDREKIYIWFAQSDLTPSMIGPPDYPDHPIPSWEEFCTNYNLSFFNSTGNGKGRNYIIVVNDEDVGTIGYDLLDKKKNRVILNIWMREKKCCGHGFGSIAINVLCNYIHEKYCISNFILSPSARNKRAIAAYKKAGFEYIKILNNEEQKKEFGLFEYYDNVLMVKRLSQQ